MLKRTILTEKEQEVINKRLNNDKLTKQDSYYLSMSIRPKLKQIEDISKRNLLKRIEYNQKAIAIERQIVNIVLKSLKNVKAIVLYGSAIQTNYSEYNDIDVLVVTKEKLWASPNEKYDIISPIVKSAEDKNLKLDIQLISADELYSQYPHSPSLIYQLEDKKVIYGIIHLPKKIVLHNIDLKMKMDWTEIGAPIGIELYQSIRNVVLVKLLISNIINNNILNESLKDELGRNLIANLKNNRESKEERIIAKRYLKKLIKETYAQLEGELWEKRVSLTV